jgi:hypothetical protein
MELVWKSEKLRIQLPYVIFQYKIMKFILPLKQQRILYEIPNKQ